MIFSWYLPEVNKEEAVMFVFENEMMKREKKIKAKQEQKLPKCDSILNKIQE